MPKRMAKLLGGTGGAGFGLAVVLLARHMVVTAGLPWSLQFIGEHGYMALMVDTTIAC